MGSEVEMGSSRSQTGVSAVQLPASPSAQSFDEERTTLRALVWMAWREMNAVRAATGSPRGYDGYSLGCSEEWWSDMVNAMSKELGEDAKPWPSEAMKPIIRAVRTERDSLSKHGSGDGAPSRHEGGLRDEPSSPLAKLHQDAGNEPVSVPYKLDADALERGSQVGDGWVIVPREPTEKMKDAHYAAHATSGRVFASAEEVYRAMLAAAPAHGGGE